MPEIGGEDAEGIIESIKRTGVLKPVEVLPDMTIIDGHQRYRTVKNNPEAPQDIPYEIKSDFGNKTREEIDDYIVTVNFQRRNLWGYYRAVTAVNIAGKWGWFEEAKESKKRKPVEEDSSPTKSGKTAQRIAKYFGVSENALKVYLALRKREKASIDREERSKLFELHLRLLTKEETLEGAKKKLGLASKAKDESKKKATAPCLRASRVFNKDNISELWEWIKDRVNEFKEKLGVVDECEEKLKGSSHDRE